MKDQELQVIFWDVQHGRSTFIKTPNKKAVFIDLGIGSYEEKKKSYSPVKHCMSKNKLHTIDKVIITHPHLDHIDDILSLDEYGVDQMYYPTGIDTSQLIRNAEDSNGDIAVVQERVKKFKKYRKYTRHYNGLNRRVTRFIVDGVKFSLYRALDQGNNLNNWSIVTVVEYLDWKFVIPGDNESPSFRTLFDIPRFEDSISDAEILLAPHHGRKNGFDPDFLCCVNPDLIIISDSHYHNTSVPDEYREYADGYDCWNRNTEKYNWRKVLSTHGDNMIVINCGWLDNEKYFDVIYG